MQLIQNNNGVDIKAWIDGVYIEHDAINMLRMAAQLPFIFKHIAMMPDAHVGIGSCIGSVIPTKGAVIPSAVGVDIGCGITSLPIDLSVSDIPEEKRHAIRLEIENLIPTGRTNQGGEGDKGAWMNTPKEVLLKWRTELETELQDILKKHPGIRSRYGLNDQNHLGTLGGGNHFIEICLDLEDHVWFMLHSGSRGVGNRIGQYFINLAKKKCSKIPDGEEQKIDQELKDFFQSKKFKSLSKSDKKIESEKRKLEAINRKNKSGIKLPHTDLAYFTEGDSEFSDYMQAVLWAQKYAKISRNLMMYNVAQAVGNVLGEVINVDLEKMIDCHHNYVTEETHFGEKILVTRKGAISARKGEFGIIPGSMGAKSYIVEGLGCEEAFCSASHGAGRNMSRSAAKKKFTVEDHKKSTEGIECVKNESVLDETPLAYKDIDTVMEAEKDLVKPICQLRQIICVKGSE